MPEEKNNHLQTGALHRNGASKKLQYLSREEVRTMEKDMARLREKEAELARERMAKIKTVEEAKREQERIEQSRKMAEERRGREEEAKRRERELERLKTERAASAASDVTAAAEKGEKEKELLSARLREAQLKEEEARRKFIEKVSAKAEGRTVEEKPYVPPVPPALPTTPVRPAVPPVQPAAPTLPTPKKPFKFPTIRLPKIRLPKISGYFPSKPSIFKKIWIKVIVSLFVLIILAVLSTFWYWYLAIRPAVSPPAQPPAPELISEEHEITPKFLKSGYYLPDTPRTIDTIIIHSGFNAPDSDPYNLEGIIQLYKKAVVATHYLINRDGAIYRLAPDEAIAFHAGAGIMPDGRKGINDFSIGISLAYGETESPNDVQYQSLAWLIKELGGKYNITWDNILGYKDVLPSKTTPWNFDWEKLRLLLSKNLTLEEKIGQLLMVGFDGTVLTPELENFIKTVRPSGVLLFKKNITEPSQIKKLLQGLQEISLRETGLPLFAAIDQEGGAVSRINFAEEKTGQYEIENADQAYKTGLERGRELRELGINLNLAPVLDITKDGDFLHNRSFQKEKPEEVGILAKALISGQKTAGILTAIKHFPGYGGIPFNPEEKLATLTDAPQISNFKKSMEAAPELVMLASVIYSSIDSNLPITFSPRGIAFLKENLGENPIVITDDLAQKSFSNNFQLKEVATLPIKAGADMLLFTDLKSGIKAASELKRAVKTGEIPENVINEAVSRVIQIKQGICAYDCGKVVENTPNSRN